MRKISRPTHDANEVFELCVNSISDMSLRERLLNIGPKIAHGYTEYDDFATATQLHAVPQILGKNDHIAIGEVTKGELKGLYTSHMVPDGKPARRIYDELRALAQKCPLCGIGQVKTLDHYLPKSKYPQYSVLPINLVPACRDCNTEKLANTTEEAHNQTIHPYFDGAHFFTDRWVMAEIQQTSPVSVVFYSEPPASWDDISKLRAAAHLSSYKLTDRFSIEVATEISSLQYILTEAPDSHTRRDLLLTRFEAYQKISKNSWQTALHHALSDSEWYCDVGYGLS
ncbi:HNH endonuclease signature motif containing protein [Cupriavidus sp. CV2]|uniref:HNH endonuclease n=1 Tax=Cupriavidus ulmosensis TaxID=3065913 RepID=UPI00296AAC17|nr:HNH endonuclease signature motif containing protein [Cupriavidus sp. CV2]MDW3689198.1 HNH endonuclease signature motif containing protein [Cupriavidus sp. CV2]